MTDKTPKNSVAVSFKGRGKEVCVPEEKHGLEVGDRVSVHGEDIMYENAALADKLGCENWAPGHYPYSRVGVVKKIVGEESTATVVFTVKGRDYLTRAAYCNKRPPRKKRTVKPKASE